MGTKNHQEGLRGPLGLAFRLCGGVYKIISSLLDYVEFIIRESARSTPTTVVACPPKPKGA